MAGLLSSGFGAEHGFRRSGKGIIRWQQHTPGDEAVPLHQAVTQPFLQKPVHAPFLVDRILRMHAVVLGVTQATSTSTGNHLADPGIVRNRLKVQSAVTNARAFLAVQEAFGSFSDYIWGFVDGKPVLLTPPDRQAFLEALAIGRDTHQVQSLPDPGVGWLAVKVLMLLVPLTALLIPAVFLIAPGRIRYHLEPGTLSVTTMLRNRRLSLTGATARAHQPRVGIKLWGTAAPGYYTGLFRADGANTKIYATSVKEGVLIEGPDIRVFINPERQAEFLEAYRSMGGVVD